MTREEIDQYLTEAIGECWHYWQDSTWYGVGAMRVDYFCSKCKQRQTTEQNYERKPNKPPQANDFSTWEGFGKLFKWAQKQDWWQSFISYTEDLEGGVIYWVEPERFATILYNFLREQQ